ncbi:MAG: ribbon-helix-helix protein, CopG family [Pseudomonadota bacterium]|nr:ribbon-helix-helix protein, CopG family [Pseudomonadota bacterium]MDP1905065.1 ribbon-helix-helix protein, CopG family [Pseudomonadota bacterium]MDP2352169.1 ribbon-helix-helix protein, CopG family [Pseudomonadota bacterium]
MSTLTLRLPDELDERLNRCAALEDISRSELARTALDSFLGELERKRFMADMVSAARVLATNPEARAESIAIAEEFLPLENEVLDIAEGRKPGDPWPEELGERWWK